MHCSVSKLRRQHLRCSYKMDRFRSYLPLLKCSRWIADEEQVKVVVANRGVSRPEHYCA